MTAADLTDVIERVLNEDHLLVTYRGGEPDLQERWWCDTCEVVGPQLPWIQAVHRHRAEAVTAAITEHAEVEVEHATTEDRTALVSRTIIRFPWKDVNGDE